MKKSFSLLEIIVNISLIALLYTIFLPKNKINYLDELTNRIELYISYTRQKALIDEKYNLKDSTWHRKRWTIKLQSIMPLKASSAPARCRAAMPTKPGSAKRLFKATAECLKRAMATA